MNATKNINSHYYAHCIIFIVLTFGIGFLPPIGGITPLGMNVLGVFLGLLYGWIFVGFIWPSLFGMFALGLTGYDSIINVFVAGFGDPTVLKIFFIFAFAGILQTTNLTTYLANWFISRKICRGKPWVLISFIFLASAIVGGFINQYAAIVIVWYLFYGICKATGYKKDEPLTSYVIVGVPIISTMGAMMFPFLPASVIFRSMLQEDILTNYAMPDTALMITHFSLALSLVIIYIILGKYILRINVDKLKSIDEDFFKKIENQKMNSEQKLSFATLIAFILILVLPLFLPDGPVKNTLQNIDILGAAVIMLMIFCCRKDHEQKNKYDFGKIIFDGINWDIIVLFASTFPVSAAMESEETGIISTVVGALMPVFSTISPMLFIVFCFVLFLLVTQVAHNIILGIVFTPVLAKIGIDMGINPYLFQIYFAWALQLAFITPGASANAALIFANSNNIGVKDSYKYTTIAVATCGLTALVLLPLLSMLF